MAATCLAVRVYEVRGAFPWGRLPVDCQKICLDRRVHLDPVLQVAECTADSHLGPVLADASAGRDAALGVAGFPESSPAPDRGFPFASASEDVAVASASEDVMAGPALPDVCWLVRQAVEVLLLPEEPEIPDAQAAVVVQAQVRQDGCQVVPGPAQRGAQQEIVLPDEELV